MPEKIIKKFQKQYGKKKGEQIYYATAKAQGRDPETFKKVGKAKAKAKAKVKAKSKAKKHKK